MTITRVTCPHCAHSFGVRGEVVGTLACVACSRPATRPEWAGADATDLQLYYVATATGLATTEAGRALGYL